MSDKDALLRAILVEPDDDAARLVFADYLQEYGDPDHAEFIRVQVELAGWRSSPDNGSEDWRHYTFLLRRERELFEAGATHRWGFPEVVRATPFVDEFRRPADGIATVGLIERGFISRVRAHSSILFGGACPLLYHEDGYWRHRGEGATRPSRCPVCQGAGAVGGIAPLLFMCQPVVGVELPGLVPERTPNGWTWYSTGVDDDPAKLPTGLFVRLPRWTGRHSEGPRDVSLWATATYVARDGADDALSAAAVDFGRELVGLNALRRPPEGPSAGGKPRPAGSPSAGPG